MRGKVKRFDSVKGWGFIVPDVEGKDVFVHHTAINMKGFRSLAVGDVVEYDVVPSAKGPQAGNVRKVQAAA